MKLDYAFDFNSTLAGMQVFGGICAALAGTFLLVNGGTGLPLGIGVLLFVVGLWNMKHQPVRLYQDHLELKLAPAAGLKMIRYRDLVRMEGDSDKVRDLFFMDGGKEKKLKLRLDVINAEDRPRLIEVLHQKIQANTRT